MKRNEKEVQNLVDLNLLPKPLTPMEPREIREPFDSPQHLFQVKWDGVRCLAYLENDRVELINRRHNYRTNQYPELIIELKKLKNSGMILDGEIIALDSSGQPNFRRVLKRDLIKNKEKADNLVAKIPIAYLVFDILFFNSSNICHLPLTERQEILASTLSPLATSALIKLVDSFPQEGISLFNAVTAQGLEGIIAKELTSPYLAGQKSAYWYKIKCWRQQQAVICGLLVKNNQLRSLLVGAFAEDKLIYLGNVASGLTEEQRKLLLAYGKNNSTKASPVINPPPKLAGKIIWVNPEIVLLIKYLEWTSDLKLRSPFIADFLTESPDSCLLLIN